MDGPLQPQSSEDLSSRIDGRRNGSFDGYAGSREGSSFTTTVHGSGSYYSFTYGQQQQQQSRSAGAANPFQAHSQTAAARDGVRRGFGSSDNLAGLGLPGHQRAGETDNDPVSPPLCCWLLGHSESLRAQQLQHAMRNRARVPSPQLVSLSFHSCNPC